MRQRKDDSPRYERVLFDDLQLDDSYLKEHESAICSRLNRAATAFHNLSGEFNAVNDCLHLASSIVLSGSKDVQTSLARLQSCPEFAGNAPSTIATIATLYFLLDHVFECSNSVETRVAINRIRTRFSDMNWMVGSSTMKYLGFDNGKSRHHG